ncbi:MAG: class I SAM-dependent methyltransferase [Actinomycetota bacterium]
MADERFLGDRDYLQGVQYGTPDKLADRQRLHRLYSTAPTPWFEWMVETIPWAEGSVVEVGCGPGQLWDEARPPIDGPLLLTDLSEGMVTAAIERAARSGYDASGRVASADQLPVADATATHVICNHMLYHVAHPPDAVRELARIVADDGLVTVATNGVDHFRETKSLEHTVFGTSVVDSTIAAFGIDNGAEMLADAFGSVELFRFPDSLRATEPAHVLAYMRSYPPVEDATADQVAALSALIDDRFAAGDGVFEITKDVGLFVCRAPRRPGTSS